MVPDLKVYRFAVNRLGPQEMCVSKNFFDNHSWKFFFIGHKYIILVMLTLESKVTFLFFLLHHFLVDCVVLSFLSYLMSSVQVLLNCATLGCQINGWKASAAAIRNTNDEENFQKWIEL